MAYLTSIIKRSPRTYPVTVVGSLTGGKAANDRMGFSVDINDDGNKVIASYVTGRATGNNGNTSGFARVFSLSGNTWNQLGSDIFQNGSNSTDQFGWCVSMNSTGNRVAAGANLYNTSTVLADRDKGFAGVYEWNNTSWNLMGSGFFGTSAYQYLGSSVSLNAAGDIFAIGATGDHTTGTSAGAIYFYTWNNSTWTSLGSIYGSVSSEGLGAWVELNAAGNIAATFSQRKNIRVYSRIGSTWTQLGSTLSGQSVAISSLGNRIVIGDTVNREISIYDYNNNWDLFAKIPNVAARQVAINNTGEVITSLTDDHNNVYMHVWTGSKWELLNTFGAFAYAGAISNTTGIKNLSLNSSGKVLISGRPGYSTPGFSPYNGFPEIYAKSTTLSASTLQDGPLIDANTTTLQTFNYHGRSTAINATGNIVVVGAPETSGSVTKSGIFRVFIRSTSTSSWVYMGQIYGSTAYNYFGNSTAVNYAGNIIAAGGYGNTSVGSNAGVVKIFYYYGSNTWIQRGNDINGSINSRCGSSISLNSIGDVIATGSPGIANTGAGSVSVYYWDNTNWILRGSTINGLSGDNAGSSVSLNAAGDVVAIGSPSNDASGIESGCTRIYSWNGSSWIQRGNDILGKNAGDQSGSCVAINAIGNRVVIGAPYNDDNGANAGLVRIYEWNGTAWMQLGSDINGEYSSSLLGIALAINATGDRIVIGASGSSNGVSGSADRGRVKTYMWNERNWVPIGSNIDAPTNNYATGRSVAMNVVGNKIVVGSPNVSTSKGQAAVYDVTVV